MKTHYILVDFENVKPKNIDLLKNSSCKLMVFVGPQQSKIPVSMALAIQSLGDNAEYLLLESSGKNSLDFLIAYYIGKLLVTSPQARFSIISKDTGFDSLISFLKAKKFAVDRCTSIEEIVTLKRPPQGISNVHVEKVITNLSQRNGSKPKSPKTLRSTLHAMFNKELSDKQLNELISQLRHRGIVKIEGTQVTYALQKPSA
ncbi:PIN domain-containing protein [Planctomicrobium sp. SH527]|uniref:PIN domain-containing protein n=1 Tax=Planctomicrobium sp. SH527 TaxID=3448123 RepID=UPI003F5AF135